MGDLAIHLGQSLFPAHGEHGMSEADKQDDEGQVTDPCAVEPAQRLAIQRNNARSERARHCLNGDAQNRDGTPDDQNYNHDGGDHHDLDRFLAGLVNALNILMPEINRDHGAEYGSKGVLGEVGDGMSDVLCDILDKARQILPRNHGADGAGQDIVEQQGGDRKLGQRPAHRLLHNAIDASSDEHGARLNVERAYGIAKQHYRQNEPGSALADDFFGIAASIIGRRGQVGEDDGSGAPKRNKRQHHRGGDEDFYRRSGVFSRKGHFSRTRSSRTDKITL